MINTDTLPTAPSPTTTHFKVCIKKSVMHFLKKGIFSGFRQSQHVWKSHTCLVLSRYSTNSFLFSCRLNSIKKFLFGSKNNSNYSINSDPQKAENKLKEEYYAKKPLSFVRPLIVFGLTCLGLLYFFNSEKRRLEQQSTTILLYYISFAVLLFIYRIGHGVYYKRIYW